MSLSREDFLRLRVLFLLQAPCFLHFSKYHDVEAGALYFATFGRFGVQLGQPHIQAAGELRSAPSAGRMLGDGLRARGPSPGGCARSQGHNWAITQKTNALTWQPRQPCLHVSRAREQGPPTSFRRDVGQVWMLLLSQTVAFRETIPSNEQLTHSTQCTTGRSKHPLFYQFSQ